MKRNQTVVIKCRDNIEGMIWAFEVLFTDGQPRPQFELVTVEEAPAELLAEFKREGQIPADARPVWVITVPFPPPIKDGEASAWTLWMCSPTIPTREQAMYHAWLNYKG